MTAFTPEARANVLRMAAEMKGRFEHPYGSLVEAILLELRRQWRAYLVAENGHDEELLTKLVESKVPRPATKEFEGYVGACGLTLDDLAAAEAQVAAAARPHANDRDKRAERKEKKRKAQEIEETNADLAPNAFKCMWHGMALYKPALAKQLGLSLGTLSNYFEARTRARLDRAQAEIMRAECEHRAAALRQAADLFDKLIRLES